MSIDKNEPDTQTVNYETFAKSIKIEMQKYNQIKDKLKEFGLLFQSSHRTGKCSVSICFSKESLYPDRSTAKLVTKTVCEMFDFQFEEPAAEDEQYRIVGYVSGFSEMDIRFGWPVELEECIIVAPPQSGSHSEHFLNILADSRGTLSELFGTYGLSDIIVPESEFSYLEISEWEKDLPFRRRSSIQDQVLAYTNWVCWGTQSVDMVVLERLLEAHKAEVTDA